MKTSQRSFACQKAHRYKDEGGLAGLRIETQMSAYSLTLLIIYRACFIREQHSGRLKAPISVLN